MLNLLKAQVLYPALEAYLKRDILAKLKTLRAEHAKSPAERAARQKRQLHQTLEQAKTHVPYYRDLFKQISFDPDKVLKSLDYFREVPLLTKDILREQGHRLLSEAVDHGKLQLRKTNGSTGLVTSVYYDQDSLDWTAAANFYASELGGRRRTDTEAHLSSRFFEEIPFKAIAIEQIKCWALNRVNVLTHAFDEAGLDELLRDLQRAKAFMVQGHASTLYHLALHAQRKGVDSRGLFKIFESTGESIDPNKTQVIETTFGCRVFNRYGNAEFGVVAHSRDSVTELEVLDYIVYPESHSVGNGLEELVLTGLLNPAMPFIRYKTGDIGEVIWKGDLAYIKNLVGRVHDIIHVNGKDYPSDYLKDVLERLGGIDEFQVVEKNGEPVKLLKIVPQPGANREVIEKKVKELFGEAFRIEYVGFDGLTLQGWRDKFRYVVRV